MRCEACAKHLRYVILSTAKVLVFSKAASIPYPGKSSEHTYAVMFFSHAGSVANLPTPLSRFPTLACAHFREADRKAGFLLKNTRFSTDPTTGQKLFSAR